MRKVNDARAYHACYDSYRSTLRRVALKDDFPAIDERLRAILRRYVPPLVVAADGPGGYTLNVDRPDLPEPRRYFGGVRVGKRYVSYYLMPVYLFPELLDDISPELKRRMQGKSCFNFARLDEPLMTQLADLTERGIQRFRQTGVAGVAVGKP